MTLCWGAGAGAAELLGGAAGAGVSAGGWEAAWAEDAGLAGAEAALFSDVAVEEVEEVEELEDTWLLEAEEETLLEEALDEGAEEEGASSSASNPPLAEEQPAKQRAAASKRANNFFTTNISRLIGWGFLHPSGKGVNCREKFVERERNLVK